MKYQCFSIAYSPVPVLAGWLACLLALRVHVDVYTHVHTGTLHGVGCVCRMYRCLCHFALVHVFLLRSLVPALALRIRSSPQRACFGRHIS